MCADLAAQAGYFLRQDDAEFGNQAAQTVVAGGALFNKSLPGSVQAQDDLLVLFFDGNEQHGGSGDGFADGGGIRCIVLPLLAGHTIGGNEFRGHEFDGVAVLSELSRPVMCTGTGFHADQARRQVGDQRQQVCAGDFRFDQYRLAVIIYTMHGKHVLGEIDSYGDNVHDFPLSWC